MQKLIILRYLVFLTITSACQIAGSQVLCQIEQNGEVVTLRVLPEPHSVGGQSKDMSVFRVRTLIAMSAKKAPWLLFEVYAQAIENDNTNTPDYRILTAQKVLAPFSTGRMEVVEPHLGRSLYYQCGEPQ